MYVKCLLCAVASVVMAAGLSACDDGKITDTTGAHDPSGGDDDVMVDMTLLDAVQRQVFTAHCVQCHGGSNHAAAGLYLTEGLSRQNLVGVTSTVDPSQKRVVAGDHKSSLLWKAIATDISKNWSYDHSHILTSDAVYLTATWIDLEN